MNASKEFAFPSSIHETLAYYVYAYIDTSNQKYVYIGKGKDNRCFSHVKAALDTNEMSEKNARILELYESKLLRIDIIAYGLQEEVAERVEASLIDVLGLHTLENVNRGKGTKAYGRKSVDEIVAELCPDEIPNLSYFKDDVILVRLSNDYFSGMPAEELYERTRGVWKASREKAEKAKFALSISRGVVREVYEVAGWFQGGSTAYWTRESSLDDEKWQEKIEFVGRVADDEVRSKYIWKSVSNLYSNGERNPIKYAGPSFD